MNNIKRALLVLERRGLIDLMNFYHYRLEIEGPEPQIMSAIDDLLDMLFDLDKRINDTDNEQRTDT